MNQEDRNLVDWAEKLSGTDEDMALLERAQDLAHSLVRIAEIIAATPENVRFWERFFVTKALSTYAYTKAEVQEFVRVLEPHARRELGGERGLSKSFIGDSLDLLGYLGLIRFEVFAPREEVCRRIVTGTETVTRKDYTQAPEVTVEVETVEWQCIPLLASDARDGE